MQNMPLTQGFLGHIGGKPTIEFHPQKVGEKIRIIGNPNKSMRTLHRLFGKHLRDLIMVTDDHGYGVRMLPSATGCVKESNPLKNALRHQHGQFFYITDLKDAYPSVSLERLALFLVYLERYEDYQDDISLRYFGQDDRREELRDDPLFPEMLSFLQINYAGPYGRGLAVGGPLSPYLMNLYCEVYLDAELRRLAERKGIVYTRYVDDLVSSRAVIIGSETRRDIREIVTRAGFSVKHTKSRVLALRMGTVHITKLGLAYDPESQTARLVFPQKKRRKLHGAIGSYLVGQADWPEMVSGLVSEFLYYYKNVAVKTKTDIKTFGLCKEFEREWAKYRHGRRPARRRA